MQTNTQFIIKPGKGTYGGTMVTKPGEIDGIGREILWEVHLPEDCDPHLRVRFARLQPEMRVAMEFDESRDLLGSNFPPQKTLRAISGVRTIEGRLEKLDDDGALFAVGEFTFEDIRFGHNPWLIGVLTAQDQGKQMTLTVVEFESAPADVVHLLDIEGDGIAVPVVEAGVIDLRTLDAC